MTTIRIGRNGCIGPDGDYLPVDAQERVSDAFGTLMEQEHFRSLFLSADYRLMSIGLAYDDYNYLLYPQLETDYLTYKEPPSIRGGALRLRGTVNREVRFRDDKDLSVDISYDPLPQTLTPGQLARTTCYDHGVPVAALRPPLSDARYYTESQYLRTYRACPNPYAVASGRPAPSSYSEAVKLRRQIREGPRPAREIEVPWITARAWDIDVTEFRVTAGFSRILKKHGPGIYTVRVWAKRGSVNVLVSRYSILYDLSEVTETSPVSVKTESDSVTHVRCNVLSHRHCPSDEHVKRVEQSTDVVFVARLNYVRQRVLDRVVVMLAEPGPSQQAPEALNRIGVNKPIDILHRVIHRRVAHEVPHPVVAFELVGYQQRGRVHEMRQESGQRHRVHELRRLRDHTPTSLDCSDNR